LRLPWTHNPLGGWPGLPADLAALLLDTLLGALLDDLRPAQYRAARFINKAFAAKLKPRLPLFHKYIAPGYSWSYVEHVMLWGDEMIRGVRPKTTENYSFLRTQVYKACTCPPVLGYQHFIHFYDVLLPVVNGLLADGTLRGYSAEQREAFAKYVSDTFSYIERYNCDTRNETPPKRVLLNAFKAHPNA